MRVLVTGASGFVGRHVLARLAARGAEVHAAARRPLSGLPGTWHATDLLDAGDRTRLMAGVEPTHLLHLAWETEHGAFWNSQENCSWALATQHLVEAFCRSGGRRVVAAGSVAEYDWLHVSRTGERCSEATTPIRPRTLYGRAKLEAFRSARDATARTAVGFAWTRLFHMFGPHEHPGRLVPSLVRAGLRGDVLKVRDPDRELDFLDVRDVATGLVAVLDSELEGAVNVASGLGVPVGRLASRIGELVGSSARLGIDRDESAVSGPGPASLVADVSRLEAEVAFSPSIDVDTALRDAIAWWRRVDSRDDGVSAANNGS